jgi:putative membrane protein
MVSIGDLWLFRPLSRQRKCHRAPEVASCQTSSVAHGGWIGRTAKGDSMIAELIGGAGTLVVEVLYVAFIVLLACGAIAAIRGRWDRRSMHLDPVLILKERLASGEIDAEEYHRLRDLIDADDARHGVE